MISLLELNEKLFFTRRDIKKFFRSKNEMNVYLHRLRKKGRIVKLNKTKYYLIPVRAFKGRWSEHPFIVIDEIFNGKGYFITGHAAAHYWGLIEQIPAKIEVKCTKKQGVKKLFSFTAIFKRTKLLKSSNYVKRAIKGHKFYVASKKTIKKWMESR